MIFGLSVILSIESVKSALRERGEDYEHRRIAKAPGQPPSGRYATLTSGIARREPALPSALGRASDPGVRPEPLHSHSIAAPEPFASGSEETQPRSDEKENRPEDLDDRFAELGKRVPGFGGLFFDEAGMLQVYMHDQEPVTQDLMHALSQAISDIVLQGAHLPPDRIGILQGPYKFLQLNQWHNQLRGPMLEISGVLLTNVDNARNRLLIGVTDLHTEQTVEDHLAQLSIPREAVDIELTEP